MGLTRESHLKPGFHDGSHSRVSLNAGAILLRISPPSTDIHSISGHKLILAPVFPAPVQGNHLIPECLEGSAFHVLTLCYSLKPRWAGMYRGILRTPGVLSGLMSGARFRNHPQLRTFWRLPPGNGQTNPTCCVHSRPRLPLGSACSASRSCCGAGFTEPGGDLWKFLRGRQPRATWSSATLGMGAKKTNGFLQPQTRVQRPPVEDEIARNKKLPVKQLENEQLCSPPERIEQTR